MVKRLNLVFAFLFAILLGAEAHQSSGGRKVKRITFDREQVSIVYTDGTQEDVASATTVKREDTATGIKAAKTTGSMSGRQWYTIDGRTLPEEPREKGVYLVKDKRGMKKTIKK